MAKIKRIVCYAVNGSGLGHVTRLMSVAKWLRRLVGLLEQRPPEILFLTSSEATQVLLRSGFASFKLPSKTVVRQAGMDMLEYRRLARLFVWQTLGTFSPDLLVVDTFPGGSFDELLQLLDGPFRKAFIQRRVKAEYAARPTFRAARSLYDNVVVPHAKPEGPAATDETYCGEVLQIEREALLDPADARARLGVAPGRKLIYLSAGGGGDLTSHAALSALVAALSPDPDLHLLVGAGPLYQGPRMGGPRLTWFTEPEIASYTAACDAAISAGGYNTFHELLYLGIPSVFYAQDKVADDQAQRIREAAAAGACLWLKEGPLDGEAVRGALGRALKLGAELSESASRLVSDNGAARCALAVLAGAYPQEQLSWAASVLTPRLALAFEAHGQTGRRLMATWLPQLLPAVHIDSLEHHPSFVALVSQLSPEASSEVQRAVASARDERATAILEDRLVALLDAGAALPGGLEMLTALVNNALKKNSPRRDPMVSMMVWLEQVLTGVLGILEGPWEGYESDLVHQLYRLFPRLVDADVARSFAAFRATLEQATRSGTEANVLMQRIRAIKFAHKRVVLETMAPLTGDAQP